MAGAVEIEVDASDLFKWADQFKLTPARNKKVIQLTLNHTGDRIRTRLTRELAKQTGLPNKTVSSAITTVKAGGERMSYDLHIDGGYMSLRVFGARQGARGVSARPWGRRRTFRGTFIVPSMGGQVFTRTKEGRLKKLWGPALPVEVFRDRAPAVLEDEIQTRLLPRLAHEITRALPKTSEGKPYIPASLSDTPV